MRDYLLTRVTAPTALPVSVADVMANGRVVANDEAGVVQAHLETATRAVEQMTGRALLPQTWRIAAYGLQHREPIWLPKPPVTALTAVAYSDASNVEQSMDVGGFILSTDDDRAMVQPDMGVNWPTTFRRPDAVRITYTAGYANAASVPQDIRHAIILLACHYFDNRTAAGDAMSEIPYGVESLVNLSRVGWIQA